MKQFIDLNCRGSTTEVCRPIKARYGAIGHNEYVPKHVGESSGVLEVEKVVKVKNQTAQGYQECPIGGVLNLAAPGSHTRRGRVQDNGQTVGTLDTGCNHGTVEGEYKIRRLTPKECFRLQGWNVDGEDTYFKRAEMVNSDTQLYKQAGNGVSVNVIHAIGERLKKEEQT